MTLRELQELYYKHPRTFGQLTDAYNKGLTIKIGTTEFNYPFTDFAFRKIVDAGCIIDYFGTSEPIQQKIKLPELRATAVILTQKLSKDIELHVIDKMYNDIESPGCIMWITTTEDNK